MPDFLHLVFSLRILLHNPGLIILSSISFAQNSDENIRLDHRFGVSLKIGGALYIGISLDAFILPQLNAEFYLTPVFGDAYMFGIGGGLKYHPLGGKKNISWSPYIGIGLGRAKFFDENEFITYVPLGVSYISKGGFNLAIDGGPAYLADRLLDMEGNPYYQNVSFRFSLKVGYRF